MINNNIGPLYALLGLSLYLRKKAKKMYHNNCMHIVRGFAEEMGVSVRELIGCCYIVVTMRNANTRESGSPITVSYRTLKEVREAVDGSQTYTDDEKRQLSLGQRISLHVNYLYLFLQTGNILRFHVKSTDEYMMRVVYWNSFLKHILCYFLTVYLEENTLRYLMQFNPLAVMHEEKAIKDIKNRNNNRKTCILNCKDKFKFYFSNVDPIFNDHGKDQRTVFTCLFHVLLLYGTSKQLEQRKEEVNSLLSAPHSFITKLYIY